MEDFKYFAEKFHYKNHTEDTTIIPNIPILTEQHNKMVLCSYKQDKDLTNQYIILIVLKIYKEQLKCCNMGYNITENGFSKQSNPIVYLFIKYTKYCRLNSKMSCTYLPSALAYNWVKAHLKLINYLPIKNELTEIDKLISST